MLFTYPHIDRLQCITIWPPQKMTLLRARPHLVGAHSLSCTAEKRGKKKKEKQASQHERRTAPISGFTSGAPEQSQGGRFNCFQTQVRARQHTNAHARKHPVHAGRKFSALLKSAELLLSSVIGCERMANDTVVRVRGGAGQVGCELLTIPDKRHVGSICFRLLQRGDTDTR